MKLKEKKKKSSKQKWKKKIAWKTIFIILKEEWKKKRMKKKMWKVIIHNSSLLNQNIARCFSLHNHRELWKRCFHAFMNESGVSIAAGD